MREIKIKGIIFLSLKFDAGCYIFDGHSINIPMYEKKIIKGVVYDFSGQVASVMDSGISFGAKSIMITAKQCFRCSISYRDVYKNSYTEEFHNINYIKIDYQNNLVQVDDGRVVKTSNKKDTNLKERIEGLSERIEDLKKIKLQLDSEKKKNDELIKENTNLKNEIKISKTKEVNNAQVEISSLKNQLAKEKSLNEKLTIENKKMKSQSSIQLSDLLNDFENLIKQIKKDNTQLYKKFETKKRDYDALVKQEKEISLKIEKLSLSKLEKESNICKLNESFKDLEEELQTLETKREILDLDCANASYEISGIKERLQLDEETASLLEDDIVLKKGTISNSLVELYNEIEVIEKRIALILKLRQRFNHHVTGAILTGNGDLSSELEEGVLDGD